MVGTAEDEDCLRDLSGRGDSTTTGSPTWPSGCRREHRGMSSGGLAGAVNLLYGPQVAVRHWRPAVLAGQRRGRGAPESAMGSARTWPSRFNNNDVSDLAVGFPLRTLLAARTPGVNVLYGSGGGCPGTGSQTFWQGPGGVSGTLEASDWFGAEVSTGDYNNNGAADLAVGVPHEAIGSRFAAGAVNVLYGASGGLTGTGSQGFWQGTGGVVGAAEVDDQFGLSLINSDSD